MSEQLRLCAWRMELLGIFYVGYFPKKTVQVIVGRVSKKESFSSNEQKECMYYDKGKSRRMVCRQNSVFITRTACMQLSLIQWDPTAVLNIYWEALFCLQGMLH